MVFQGTHGNGQKKQCTFLHKGFVEFMTVLITIFTSVLAFAATNIDDIFILMMFFSQTDHTFRRRHVVLGQYLGFVAIIAVCLLGFWGSFLIPKEFIGLLGLLPITIGICKFARSDDEIESLTPAASTCKIPPLLGSMLHPMTYCVAAVTLANGGDNIGIYIPLFASLTLPNLILTIAIFLLLVLLWCLVGMKVADQRHIARFLSCYCHVIVPLVLIGLGVFIIIENGTLRLFGF
jgi:cadmium resistance transport/sequestration family protein